eukprot:6470742-Amphidinium_carterae.1
MQIIASVSWRLVHGDPVSYKNIDLCDGPRVNGTIGARSDEIGLHVSDVVRESDRWSSRSTEMLQILVCKIGVSAPGC